MTAGERAILMNARVCAIRSGRVPRIPGLDLPSPSWKEVADAA
jgi:hypothetical protein